MSRQRRHGSNGDYSDWHYAQHDDLTAIDIDWIEYCRYCRRPLALVETAHDVGQDKSADVLRRIGEMASIPVWTALSREVAGRQRFRVRRVFPESGAGWRDLSSVEWYQVLAQYRTCHPISDES